MDNTLTAATLNINGLQNNQKRKATFNWLKSLNFDVIYLQETHCHTRKDVKKWSHEWGPGKNSIWSTGSSNSKGVAVLFKPHIDYNVKNCVIDTNGRYILFELIFNEEIYKFVNIYSPNDCYERVNFFQRLNTWVDDDNFNLVGGDFNCTLDSELDRMNCTSKSDVGQVDLKNIIYNKSLEDIYRRRYPDERSFSWSRGNKSSRLDYWLISKSLDCQVDQVQYLSCPFSDHRLASLKLSLSQLKHGPGTWKMNASVIDSDIFVKSFTSMWKDWQNQKNNYNIYTWWDLGKKKIKELTIWCASKLKADKNSYKSFLEKSLNLEHEKLDKDINLIKNLEESLKSIMYKEVEGAKIRSRLQWVEEGEKPTNFFHNLEKCNAKNKTWTKILNKENQIVNNTNEIINVQVDFYKNLYTSEGSKEAEREFFGKYINKKVSDKSYEVLDKEIEMQDIFNAIKNMKSNSSPGPDGIVIEFYLKFFDMIKYDLLEVFETSYADRHLAYSQYLALIILLYKKGTREKITNWRPISLSNTDVKIITKVLADRLKQALPDIIHANQSGGVKGRKIGQNIRLIEDILEDMDGENLILLIDQQKAFDRVEWEWLFYVLEKFNFGEYFINWVKLIYKDMKSAILTNGYVSPYFSITRGIRQGDSLSALLYVVQAEALSECIRNSNDIKGIPIKDIDGNTSYIKGSQYVDDSNTMLHSADYIHNCLALIEKFGDASGSRINKSKTVALISEHFSDNREIGNIINLNKGCEIVLGVPIGNGVRKEVFWKEKIDKMHKRIQMWKARDLTIFGKVHIVKSLILPLIQYAASNVHVDYHIIQNVQKIIWSYIWKWGTCFVSKELCYLPRNKGGLGIPNFGTIIKAAQIKMVIDIMKNDAEWNILGKKHLCCLDKLYNIKYFALLVDGSYNSLDKCNIPLYYKECILAIQELNRKGLQKCENEIIWCNNNIRFQGKVLELNHWSKNGLCYLSDISDNGKLDRNKILGRLQNKSAFIFEYAKLNKSVPEKLLQNNNPDVSPNFHEFYYNVPGKKKTTHIYDLTTKEIYSILIQGEKLKRKSEKYWSDKLFGLEMNYPLLYEKLFVCKIIPRDILDFNWRIFNGQVLTEKKLRLMKLSDGICSCCKVKEEDIFHLFIECTYFESTWIDTKLILNKISDTVIEIPNQLFGFLYDDCKYDIMNMILSITRWYIWKHRCSIKYGEGNKSNLHLKDELKIFLKSHIKMMLQLNKIKNTKMIMLCNDIANML